MYRANKGYGHAKWSRVCLAGMALLVSTASLPAEVALYVSPRGQVGWTGALSEPNADQSDGPLPSIQAARDLIRKQRAKGTWKDETITVYLRGGTYFLPETLIFEPRDSGANGKPVTYAAYQDETPILSGGRVITGWRNAEVNGQPCWAVEIPDVKQGKWYFRQLFINGRRCPRPRVPREGVYFFTGVRESDSPDKQPGIYDEATFRPGELRNWANLGDIEIVTLQQCDSAHMIMREVEEAEHIVKFTKRGYLQPGGNYRSEQFSRYYAVNVKEALDTPGQWYLDRPSGRLYYRPLPGETPEQVIAIAPKLDILLKMQGDPKNNNPVHDLALRGLSFRHNNWHMPPDTGYGQPGQSMYRTPPCGALQCGNAVHCRIIGCLISQVSAFGIELTAGCANNVIAECTLTDLGGGGIKVGHNTSYTIVTDNEIRDGGRIFHDSIGLWVGDSWGNIVSHNHIHHLYYTGICVGDLMAYLPSKAICNTVEYNHVHHIGQGLLSDMGGIYTLSFSPGTVIRYNLVHDVEDYDFGGDGLYNDFGSGYILMENNIVYRISGSPYHSNGSKEVIVRNNIFAFGGDKGVSRTRHDDHLSFTFERNIFYENRPRAIGGRRVWKEGNFLTDHNLYYSTDPKGVEFPGDRTFAQWQEAFGQDRHSLIADPLFVDPQNGDFTLKPGSPAEKIGFVLIDTSRIGRLKR